MEFLRGGTCPAKRGARRLSQHAGSDSAADVPCADSSKKTIGLQSAEIPRQTARADVQASHWDDDNEESYITAEPQRHWALWATSGVVEKPLFGAACSCYKLDVRRESPDLGVSSIEEGSSRVARGNCGQKRGSEVMVELAT